MHPAVAEVLLDADTIARRVQELGQEITRDYPGEELVLVSILKGSMMFTADLIRAIELPVVIDFMSISSYGASTRSSGVVKIVKDLEERIEDRHVLVVEDIVDTGLTLRYLLEALRLRRPHSVKTCALLSKPARRKVEVPVEYLGFTIEDRFVIGYGLDYRNHYRQLPYIGVIRPEMVSE
ncbi:MAG: hypoxanthine phosphoribosyltransferase [Candidatus Eremiobacterota bacterium]